MLRGLCPNSHVDVFYTLMWDEEQHLPYYKGFMKSSIHYNESTESWQLMSSDNSVNGVAVSDINSLGTGIS